MAPVGHASMHALQSLLQVPGLSAGRPVNRFGISGSGPSGYFIVRYPCCNLAFKMLIIFYIPLQIVSTVRKIKAFVAERKIGDLLVPHCHSQAKPVME